jgi:hypothetical protein
MPRRILNWDNAAVHWAIAQVGKPFAWGETDCVSLLRGMLAEIYGEPIGSNHSYADLPSALAVTKLTGGPRQVLWQLGADTLPGLPYANTGDVLIAPPREDEPFESVMPVITDKYLFTQPDSTVLLLPLQLAPDDATAYRLPFAWGEA